MNSNMIRCPHCGKDIEVTEVLTHQIRASMKAELEGELGKREQEFARQQAALKQREKELLAAKETLDEQVNEKLRVERANLSQQKKALDEQRLQIDEQVSAKLRSERQRLSEEAMKRAKEETAGERKAMADELAEQKAKLAVAQSKELELRRQQRQLEEQKSNMELELARKLDEERKKITDAATKKAAEQEELKLREKDNLIRQMQEELSAIKHKLEKGSQEAQGEALEGSLIDKLSHAFGYDVFEDVKKGARGADICQRVRNANGRECGVVLWEAKNAQTFSKEWIAKLKNDQQEAGADIAVIATVTLPKEVDKFGIVDDVWVTDYKNALCLALVLRHLLISVAREKVVVANQNSKKDILYRYITSQEFGMQFKSAVAAFGRMREDLDSEKRSMQKYWKSREKQIEMVFGSMSNIYGAIEGYVGQKELPQIDPLMLESPAGGIDE